MKVLCELYKKWFAVRYLLVGVFNTLFSIVLYPILYYTLTPLDIGYLKVLIIQYGVAVSLSFVTNKHLVFNSKGEWREEYFKFIFLQAVFFAINLLYLPVIVTYYELNPAIAQTIYALIIVVVSYFWNKHVSFRKKEI